jgi:hypothetical protein
MSFHNKGNTAEDQAPTQSPTQAPTQSPKENTSYVPSAANLRKLTAEQEKEWNYEFMVECKRRWKENVRVELEPFRMLECERRWQVQVEEEEKKKQKEQQEQQKQQEQQEQQQGEQPEGDEVCDVNPVVKLEEVIFTYPDGSNYMGEMWKGKKHGKGTLRTAAFVYGRENAAANYTSDEAAENGHLATWNEYIGCWKNDKMHGYGCHVRKFGDGSQIMLFEGIWIDGVQEEDCAEYD